jgi:multicomponent K+:H+ antiporter subunit G
MSTLPLWADVLVAALLVLGAAFCLLGAIGLVRLPDFYTRLHGPSKASTLGVGAVLLGSALWFGVQGSASGHELLVVMFLLLTAPVSAQVLARAALHLAAPQTGIPPEPP